MEKLVDPLNHQALDCYLKVCNNPLTIFDYNNDADDDDIPFEVQRSPVRTTNRDSTMV